MAATTVSNKTQVMVSIEEAVYQAASKHAYSRRTGFSQVVQEALEAYLTQKGKK